MAELIECRECNERNCQGCNIHTLATMLHAGKLKSIMSDGYCVDPFAEVQPVRHGRWVNERMLIGGFAEKWGCDCSCCGRTIEEPLWKPDYCPHCGAKMDKENDNG